MVGKDVSQSQLLATKTHIETYHKTSPLHHHPVADIIFRVPEPPPPTATVKTYFC